MLCPSCNKFAAYDTSAEPEIEVEVEIDPGDEKTDDAADKDHVTAMVTGNARIFLTAECCGDELKEAQFEISQMDFELTRAPECTCDLSDLSVDASGEVTDRSETQTKKTKKDGTVVVRNIPYRYQKRFYGVDAEITVSCSCGKTTATEHFTDEVQASGMDELV